METFDHPTYTSKFFASQVQGQFCLQILINKAYLAHEKALKKIVSDFGKACDDPLEYIHKLRFKDDTYIALMTIIHSDVILGLLRLMEESCLRDR